MAHISEYKLQDGTIRYRAHVHRAAHKAVTQGGFKYKRDADRWATEQERSILLTGMPRTHEEYKKILLSKLVKIYLEKITPGKASHVSEAAMFNKFLGYDICKLSLAAIKQKDVYDYIEQRRKEKSRHGRPISDATIRRDINSIGNVFVIARKKWGYEDLPNPFAGDLDLKSTNRRKRRLEEGEENELWKACERCLGLNRFYVPLAIALAIHTGMRLQEIFNLTWQDIDFKKRRIEIRRSKTDHKSEYAGRTIVLTIRADYFLSHLAMHLSAERRLKLTDRIFPMNTDAFKQSWADVRKRAKIKGLVFHDLRREAGSRFDVAGLTKAEHDLMMGHKNNDMTSLYIHSELKTIQDKLDRYMLNGKTLDEAWKEWGASRLGLPKGARIAESVEELKDWMGQLAKVKSNVVAFTKAKAS
jgi:integrase